MYAHARLQGVENLFDRQDRMASYGPTFCDITWGAGGTTADLTLDIAAKMQNMARSPSSGSLHSDLVAAQGWRYVVCVVLFDVLRGALRRSLDVTSCMSAGMTAGMALSFRYHAAVYDTQQLSTVHPAHRSLVIGHRYCE